MTDVPAPLKPSLSFGKQRFLAQERLHSHLSLRNLRLTPQRQAVFEAVLRDGGHFEAEGLAEYLRNHRPRVSRATVYRTLELMRECHLLEKLDFEDQGSFYELTLPGGHHDHLICVKCGLVTEFNDPPLEKLQQGVCQRYGFKETHHSLRIFGLCEACSASA